MLIGFHIVATRLLPPLKGVGFRREDFL